jgi:hypothetical protein
MCIRCTDSCQWQWRTRNQMVEQRQVERTPAPSGFNLHAKLLFTAPIGASASSLNIALRLYHSFLYCFLSSLKAHVAGRSCLFGHVFDHQNWKRLKGCSAFLYFNTWLQDRFKKVYDMNNECVSESADCTLNEVMYVFSVQIEFLNPRSFKFVRKQLNTFWTFHSVVVITRTSWHKYQ